MSEKPTMTWNFTKIVFLLNDIFTWIGSVILIGFPTLIFNSFPQVDFSPLMKELISSGGGILAGTLAVLSALVLVGKDLSVKFIKNTTLIMLIFHILGFGGSFTVGLLISPKIFINALLHTFFIILFVKVLLKNRI